MLAYDGMRVLFLTAEPPWPLDQGDKLRNYHFLRALAEEYEVTLVSFCLPGEEMGDWRRTLTPLCQAIHTVSLNHQQMLVNVLRLPHLPMTMAARASFQMARLLRQLTKERQYDVAFACQLKMAGYLRHCFVIQRVADLTDVVSLYRRRMAHFVPSWQGKVFGFLEAQRLAVWEKRVARSVGIVLLVSAVDATELGKMVPEAKIAVLPNGVDLTYFQPLPDPEKPILLFYGHLRYPPNIDGITWFCKNILPHVRKTIPTAELLIAGKEPPQEVRALGSLSGVKIIGYVPDLRSFLVQGSVVVVPLRFGAGIRNKILEAFAADRAVVSTSLGCEGLNVVPGVHLAVADEPSAFAAAVIDLLRDPLLRARLAANARKMVEEEHSWNLLGQRLRVLLKDLSKGEAK